MPDAVRPHASEGMGMAEPDDSTKEGLWHELASVLGRARDVWTLIGPGDRRRLGLVLIPTLLTSMTANAVPLLLSAMVNQLTVTHDNHAMAGTWTTIAVQYVGLIALVTLASESLLLVRKFLVSRVCTRIERNLSIGLMRHLFKENLQTLSREQIGVLHGRAVRGVEGFIKYLKLGFKEFFPLFCSVVTALVYAFCRDPRIGLLMVIGLVLTVLIAARQLNAQKGMHLAMVRGRSRMDGKMIEQLEGIEYIRVADTIDVEIGQLAAVADERQASDTRLTLSGALHDAIKSLNDWALALVVLGYSVHLAAIGEISIGDIVAMVGLAANMARPLRDLHRIIDDAYEVRFRVDSLIDLLDDESDASFAPSIGPSPTIMQGFEQLRGQQDAREFYEPTFERDGPVFSARNVTVEYVLADGRRHRVLDDVSLEIARGETIGFAGPSGSGKSTLLKVLMRLTHPVSGSASLGGVAIEHTSRDAIGRAVAYVGQNPYVFSGTVAENIVYGTDVPPHDQDQIRRAAEHAGIHDEVMAMPDGYQTVLHQRGQNLSGGQRQRIAIARAFLKDAPLLILDEGTSALDTISEHRVQQAIETLWRGRTVIMVAHRLTTLRAANKIVVFDGGRIAQIGTMAELSSQEGVFRELLRQSQDH